MEGIGITYAVIDHEWFSKTNDLKWVKKITPIDDLTHKEELVLHQRWQGSDGSSYWVEVEVEE